jgi:beta-galactosidase/beta-glucuronidase
VWLESTGNVRIARDGVHILTRTIGTGPDRADAAVDVAVHIDGPAPATANIVVEFELDGQLVARRKTGLSGAVANLDIPIPAANLWSAERPHLYDVSVSIIADGGEMLDERRFRTGLRTVEVDARRGLRVNGHPVLLRGAAVHHDSGPLGAATFAKAERRRARLLKEAGYNAIRSAHNPLSRAFLDACHELGLYVMDELTDVWFGRKTPHHGAERFRDAWRDDAVAMIA